MRVILKEKRVENCKTKFFRLSFTFPNGSLIITSLFIDPGKGTPILGLTSGVCFVYGAVGVGPSDDFVFGGRPRFR
jgi:hypothetical protein